MNTVFLYAGQGSQKPGMGLDLYEQYPAYRAFAESLDPGFDHLKLMHEGPEDTLSRTEYTQFCMGVFQAGVTRLLLDEGIRPAAACGLSLGEYGALLAAGVFGDTDYLQLLKFRGAAMAEASAGLTCCMSAVLGADYETVLEACETYSGQFLKGSAAENAPEPKADISAGPAPRVTVANCNCPGQNVICGDEEDVTAVEALLREKGVRRFVHLKVSGPFHTSRMAPAGEALRGRFRDMDLNAPRIPVAMNVTGRFLDPAEDIAELLVRQVQGTVLLTQDLTSLLDAGYTDFTEIGPGSTMAGFLKKTAKAAGKAVTVRSIETADDLRAAVAALKGAGKE